MGLKDWLGGNKKSASDDPEAVLEQIAQTRRMGRLEDARSRVTEALRTHPRHPGLLKTHWDLAVQLGHPTDAVRSLLLLLQLELRSGAGSSAVFHWFEFVERVEDEPTLDLDTRARLAEAMLAADQEDEAARLLESCHEDLPPATPPGVLIRLAKAALESRSPSAEALAEAAKAHPATPAPLREELDGLLARARQQGLRTSSAEAGADDSPIELATAAPAVRKLRLLPAVPLAVDGDQISLDLAGQGRRKMALSQVQGLATARIDDGVHPAWIVIDLLLDSLWSDQEVIRTVRLRTLDFDPETLAPDAGDFQLALGTLLSNLLAVTGAHPLPDADAVVGRPFAAFSSLREYEVRVLEVTP